MNKHHKVIDLQAWLAAYGVFCIVLAFLMERQHECEDAAAEAALPVSETANAGFWRQERTG